VRRFIVRKLAYTSAIGFSLSHVGPIHFSPFSFFDLRRYQNKPLDAATAF
jgi:hypothetical protein